MTTLEDFTGTLVLAGAGKMGGAMLSGWLASGLDPARVAIVEPAPSPEIATLAPRGLQINPELDTLSATALVIAVKPQMSSAAAPLLRSAVTPQTLVVSIMAGVPVSRLQTGVGGAVVRAMPNTPAAIGRALRRRSQRTASRKRSATSPMRCSAPPALWPGSTTRR